MNKLENRMSIEPFPNDQSNNLIPLVGYTTKERYYELKESFKIKTKNFEKLCSENAEMKKLLEEVVQMLKSENKKLKLMLRYFNKDSRSFLYLLPDRESKLKYGNKTPEEMIDSMSCRLGRKKNILNMLIYRHKKMHELEKEIDREIDFLDQVCGNATMDKQITEDISRQQTEIEHLRSRARTNSFIKSSYVPILSLLKTELYYFPIRIHNTERALEHNKKELKEIKLMNRKAKEAKHHAFKQLKQLQEEMDKERKDRGEAVALLKRNMGQRSDAFEKMKRKRLSINDMCNDVGTEYRMQLNKTRLARFKINDLFGSIKSTLLETRIMNACQTMLNNDEMNQSQANRKILIDKKYKNMQRLIKQAQLTKVRMVQSNSSNREKYRAATNEMEERIKILRTEIEEKKKKLRTDGDLLMNIKKGISALGSKLSWIEMPGLREENSVPEIIMNIAARLDELQRMKEDLTHNMNIPEVEQNFCLSKLLAKEVEKRFSEEDHSQADIPTSFEDVLEINDDTPMVRNFMKTASKRLIMRQKKKK